MIGRTISHYKIIEKLGEGGMGVIYLAEDTKLERKVAIKFLPHYISINSEERERFKIEAKAAAALNHPNIATVHAIEESEDEMFIVMEYIDGVELKDKIKSGPLPIEEAINIATQIAEGLEVAHKNGIVHRDIKSQNIMITGDGKVKIMDFGLAKIKGGTQVTKIGTTIGTVAYMSPEQSRGQDVDHRTDIWSLGVVLYEMLTGQLPFKGDYEQAIIYSILNEEPESVIGLRTGVPVVIEKIINKCLQKDLSSRYKQADELLVELRQINKESDTRELLSTTGIKPVSQKTKKRSFLIPGIAAIVILLIIAGYFFIGNEPESTERLPIAVTDFINQTNEPELDGLSGMLITALEQSRKLAVVTRSRMFDISRADG